MRLRRVTDQTWDGWLYHSHLVHPFPTRIQASRKRWREVTTKENQVVTQVVCKDPKMEREKILSEQKDLHNFLERKADHAFQGERAAQTRLSEVHAELDRRDRKIWNADIDLFETGMQLQSQMIGTFIVQIN